MSNRNAFLFFLVGTLASLVLFLALTWDTHQQVDALTNADKLSDQVVAGKHVFEKKNCNECHTILGFGVYYAPDLTRAYARIGAEGIKTVVLQPEVVFKDSFRKMPNLDVTEQEADDLVAFLEWTSNIDNHDWPPQDKKFTKSADQRRLEGAGLSPGAAAFKEYCMSCHSIGGEGAASGRPSTRWAPSTTRPPSRRTSQLPPQSIRTRRCPPRTDLTEQDRQAIGEFLAKQN
ncbi:MAG: cytochrome c [Thermoleophilia bacterium]|nr:cytochrome c [Thermoleophilia bacterium]